MYVELIILIITLIIIYFCLKNKKETFNTDNTDNTDVFKWYNTSIADYDKNKQISSAPAVQFLKESDESYYTESSNLNPSVERENDMLNGKKMFYYEKNTDNTKYSTDDDRKFLYQNFGDKEKEIYKEEAIDGPKISNKVAGHLYYDSNNKRPNGFYHYNNKRGNIDNMNIENYSIYQMQKKEDIPYEEKFFFNSKPEKRLDSNGEEIFNDIHYKYQDLVNKDRVIKKDDISIEPNFYTSVPEKNDGENIFEIKKIIFKMPGEIIPINLKEITLFSNGKELNPLNKFNITARFTQNNRYYNDNDKTENIIDGKLETIGHSAPENQNLVQDLILDFTNVNSTFDEYKYNIDKIKIYNRKDNYWFRLFDLRLFIVFKNLVTNEEIEHNLKIENHKPIDRHNVKHKEEIEIHIPKYNNLKLRKQRYNDLFGKLHKEQGKTDVFVVSRGFPHEDDIEIGYEQSTNNQVNPLTNRVVKSCPIPAVQTYHFDPSPEGLALGLLDKDEETARKANYFTEKGGTYNDGTNCRLCDFPDGCFSPWAADQGDPKRVKQFESQSCRKGKNRECMPCSECTTGEERIVSFCGEGGGKVDTKCAPCTPCPEGFYKVYGCDKPDTTIDNYCVPMTQCKGKPINDKSYEDPGKENYYYMKKDGTRGSNSYNPLIDKNGSYTSHYFKKYGGDVEVFEQKMIQLKFKSKENNIKFKNLNFKLNNGETIYPLSDLTGKKYGVRLINDDSNFAHNIYGDNGMSYKGPIQANSAGDNKFEIKRIVIQMVERYAYVGFNEMTLISNGEELKPLNKFNITATFTQGNKYYLNQDRFNTKNIIDGDLENMGHAADGIFQDLILDFTDANEAFNPYKLNIDKIKIYNRKDACCSYRIFKTNMYIELTHTETEQEIRHNINLDLYKDSPNNEIIIPMPLYNRPYPNEVTFDLTNFKYNSDGKIYESQDINEIIINNATILNIDKKDIYKITLNVISNYGRVNSIELNKMFKEPAEDNLEVSLPIFEKLNGNFFYNNLENNKEEIQDAIFKLLSKEEKEKIPNITSKNSINVTTLTEGNEQSKKLPPGVIYKIEKMKDEDKYQLRVYFNENKKGKKNNNWIRVCKTTERQKNREGKNILNPYYGQDRECAKCDVCPEGFELLPGTCTDKNSFVNSICQRKIDIDTILQKDLSSKCGPGKIYDKKIVKKYLNNLNIKQEKQDNEIRIEKYPILEDYLGVDKTKDFDNLRSSGNLTKEEIDNITNIDFKDINNPNNYPWIKEYDISDEALIKAGCVDCKECGTGYFIDPLNPGCKNGQDTVCIKHKKCKTDGSERLIVEGTSTTDNVCGPCKCPDGLVGEFPSCNGTKLVDNCKPNEICDDSGGEKKYYYDKPGDYGNTTKKNKCVKCDKECPVGTYKIGGCDENGNGNIICKNHRECDKETMLVVEPGTSTKDTVCKCIDGYDWPKMFQKDGKSFGAKNMEANKCVEIKGQCHNNPCHPNAYCYDNFNNESGAYESTVCKCDLSEGYVETESLGFGENGCKKFPNKHFHKVGESDEKMAPGLSSNVKNIINHLGEDYHRRQLGKHLHKNYIPAKK